MIDVGKSTSDVIKEEDSTFPTNGSIIVIVLMLDETDGVFCTSPKDVLIAYKLSIGSHIKQKLSHVFRCIRFQRLITTKQTSQIDL